MALPQKAQRVIEIARTAHTVKGDLNTLWQNLAEMHMPEQADFTIKKDPHMFASELYDSSTTLYRRDFANWLGTVLRPKGRPWFKGKFREWELNEHQSVMLFTQKQDKAHRGLLYDDRSNFISQSNKADHDYALFGNSVTFVDNRAIGDGFSFRTCHLRDCAWMENDDGEVDTMFRRLKLQVKTIVGNEKRRGWTVPSKIKSLLDKEPNRWLDLQHICMPSDHYHMGDKPTHKDREFICLYVCEEFNCVLQEIEVHEFRYQVSRWFRLSGSPYAVSPAAMVSQPDAMTLQSMAWSIMQAGELAVEPPLVAQSEAIVSPVNLFASGVTWVDKNYDERTGRAISPVDLGKHPDAGILLHQSMRETMGEAWYLNKLTLPDFNHEMTAYEVQQRMGEFLRVTQPIIEPAEPERNGSILRITHSMAWRQGWMGLELPEEVEGKDLTWSYDNPIEDARNRGLLATFQESMQITLEANEIDPTAHAGFKLREAHREVMLANAPANWMHEEDSEELEQAQASAEEQIQTQQTMAQMGEGAAIAKDANAAGLI